MYIFTSKIRATKMVYGVEPDLTREGGSIPVTLTLQVVFLWKIDKDWWWMVDADGWLDDGCWWMTMDADGRWMMDDRRWTMAGLLILFVNANCSGDKLWLPRRQLERMWFCCQWVPLTMELILRTRKLTSGAVRAFFSVLYQSSHFVCLFRNYIEGTKLLGAYAYQLSQL